jgi:hypothetical protein
MLKDGSPIGAIAIPERQIQLLQTFADQAPTAASKVYDAITRSCCAVTRASAETLDANP